MNTKLTCTQNGDYFLPNIVLTEAATGNIGKYGRMRKCYLQAHRPGLYNRLLLLEKLQAHLLEINQAARQRLEVMLPRLAAEAGATEALKACDPLKWAGLMNTCKAQAEEAILSELVYK